MRLLLTEKWMACVPCVRIFCLTYAFQPIHTANLNAIKALGHSDIFLKLEVIKKLAGFCDNMCVHVVRRDGYGAGGDTG